MATEIAQIDQTRCSGCGRCISACEFQLFSFETKAWKKTAVLHDIDRCNGCGECASKCVIGALIVAEKAVAGLSGISRQHGSAASPPKTIIDSTC